MAPNIVKAGLNGFVDAGLMERHRYSKHPERCEYLLTDKGRDFLPVVLALIAQGDRWAAPDGVGAQNWATGCDLGFPVRRASAARERQDAGSWRCGWSI